MADKHQRVEKVTVDVGGQIDPNQATTRMAFFTPDGAPIDPTHVDTGDEVKLTGYAPHAAGPVAAADSTNVAIAKLEARIAALEAA